MDERAAPCVYASVRIAFVGVVVLVLLAASSIHAQPVTARVIRFDPPNPTDANAVTIHVSGPNPSSCFLESGDAAINGSTITVTVHASQCSLTPPSPDAWFHVAVPVGPLHAGQYDVAVSVDGIAGTTSIGSSKLVVRDAAPPFEVIPNVVSYYDGSSPKSLELVGKGINQTGCRICPKLLVHLGDVTVDVTNELNTSDSIHVPLPLPFHAPGVVDVSIERDGVIVYRSHSALAFMDLPTGDPAFFEQVLIPVSINGPGAFGTQWSTVFVLYNANDYRLPKPFAVVCDPAPCFVPGPRSLFGLNSLNAPEGLTLSVPRQAAKRVTFGLLARDLSRQRDALGTELPVVRETDLRDGEFSLLSVPADPRFRVALRLYGIDDVRGVVLRIHAMDDTSSNVLVQKVTLRPPSYRSGSATFGYVGDLLTHYPQIVGKGPLHLEVDANGARVWGFISVTNNETQHVTVISPQ